MDLNMQKEAFQRAYFCALAAQAGYNTQKAEVDDDSVDIGLRTRGFTTALIRNPQIEFQLKCSSQNLVIDGLIKFPLSRKNYEDLRGENVAMPRYLAVLLVPESAGDWIVHHGAHIALHERCFWLSLRDAPAKANTTSITVDVPLAQRLTTDVLRQMMEAASQGEWL